MGFLRRFPISLQVPLMTAALMVLVGIIASQQVLSTLADVQNARIRELAQLQIEALSVALGPQVLRKDVWGVYDILDRATSETEVRRLTFTAVADKNGRVLAATDPKRAPLDSPISLISAGAQNLADLSASGKGNHIRLLSDLVYQNRVVGQILTEMNVSDLLSERKQAVRLLLLVNALVTGVLALLGYWVMRRVLAPITEVMQRMRETAEAPGPIPETDFPQGNVEMTQLMRSYNTMADAVTAKAEADRRLAEREKFVSLGRLSSSLAHEVNNPLGGLLNAADTIREYADRPKVVRQSADLLIRGLGHLRDVARATLDQNRLDRAGLPLSAEDFDDLHLLIGPEVSRMAQTLEWNIEAAHTLLAKFASAQVRQISLNLLLNATEAAGEKGQVSFQATNDDKTLQLEISNSGPDLPKAARARLLGTGTGPQGGGVGLRLVHDLVAELNGHIQLSRDNNITLIRIELPLPESKSEAVC
jgi:signal transduction histidine kinase